MFAQKTRARYGGTASAVALVAVLGFGTALASDSQNGQYVAMSGESGGLDVVAFERIGAPPAAGAVQECEYFDEWCNNVEVPVIALAQPDPYDPGGELDAMAGSQGGLVPVAFEPADIGGIGLGLKGEPAGHSIGHDGSLEGELVN